MINSLAGRCFMKNQQNLTKIIRSEEDLMEKAEDIIGITTFPGDQEEILVQLRNKGFNEPCATSNAFIGGYILSYS